MLTKGSTVSKVKNYILNEYKVSLFSQAAGPEGNISKLVVSSKEAAELKS